jgi:hypothetical protein
VLSGRGILRELIEPSADPLDTAFRLGWAHGRHGRPGLSVVRLTEQPNVLAPGQAGVRAAVLRYLRPLRNTRQPHASRSRRNWKRWGPYLSERQWGTVREDYSADGALGVLSRTTTPAAAPTAGARTACSASPTASAASASPSPSGTAGPHPQGAPLRPHQPRGQPRRGREGVYYYLDSTPTHSYMKALYKYPQARVPLRAAGRGEPRRGRRPRVRARRHRRLRRGYFDVTASTPRRARTTSSCAHGRNRGPGAGRLHVLPTLWFRNTWSWGRRARATAQAPRSRRGRPRRGRAREPRALSPRRRP